MADEAITLIAYQHAKPEKRKELAELLNVVAESASREEGCELYQLHFLQDDPSVFFFYERWANQAALDKHLNSTAFQDFWSVRGEYLNREVEIKLLKRP